ncbi:MAG: hypothetical protein AAGI71_03155 [Bacteroidota bacterium]
MPSPPHSAPLPAWAQKTLRRTWGVLFGIFAAVGLIIGGGAWLAQAYPAEGYVVIGFGILLPVIAPV